MEKVFIGDEALFVGSEVSFRGAFHPAVNLIHKGEGKNRLALVQDQGNFNIMGDFDEPSACRWGWGACVSIHRVVTS
ncbi:hypothetical protein [Methylomagnum ishizawai]|uniref:hypothetical protein n=1 Tax=Methylomagnum ishizawai TaxID=1760988 RepID=UPI001C81E068|nr:hypothetical protein [Methylomagnum ishizawai]